MSSKFAPDTNEGDSGSDQDESSDDGDEDASDSETLPQQTRARQKNKSPSPMHAKLEELEDAFSLESKTKAGPIHDKLRAGELWVVPPNPVSVTHRANPSAFYLRPVFLWFPDVSFPWLVAQNLLRCAQPNCTGILVIKVSRPGPSLMLSVW